MNDQPKTLKVYKWFSKGVGEFSIAIVAAYSLEEARAILDAHDLSFPWEPDQIVEEPGLIYDADIDTTWTMGEDL